MLRFLSVKRKTRNSLIPQGARRSLGRIRDTESTFLLIWFFLLCCSCHCCICVAFNYFCVRFVVRATRQMRQCQHDAPCTFFGGFFFGAALARAAFLLLHQHRLRNSRRQAATATATTSATTTLDTVGLTRAKSRCNSVRAKLELKFVIHVSAACHQQ